MKFYITLLVSLCTKAHMAAPTNQTSNLPLVLDEKQTASGFSTVAFWVSLSSSSNAVLSSSYLVGRKTQVHLDLCRAVTENVYRAGNIVADNGRMSCRLAKAGYPSLHQNFQMLQAEADKTKWVLANGEVPKNAIVGGSHPVGFLEYVCRAPISSNFIAGNYNPNMRACYIATGEKEFMITTQIEILVANVPVGVSSTVATTAPSTTTSVVANNVTCPVASTVDSAVNTTDSTSETTADINEPNGAARNFIAWSVIIFGLFRNVM